MSSVVNIKSRIPELDGIRAIALILVVLFHLGFYYGYLPVLTEFLIMGGEIGVALFFFLSGFLMVSPFIVAASKQNEFYSVKRFYKARFLRIIPLLFFTNIIFIITRQYNVLNKGLDNYYSFIDYIKCFLLIDHRIIQLNPVLWTLKIEMIFYLIFPLYGYLIFWGITKRKMSLIWIVIIISILLSSFYFVWFPSDNKSFFSACYMLLLGTANRIMLVNNSEFQITPKINSVIRIIAFIIVLALTYYIVDKKHQEYQIILVIFLNVLFYLTLTGTGIFNKFLSIKILSQIALISYSLYLWHFNVHYMISHPYVSGNFKSSVIVEMLITHVISLSITFVLSYLSYNLIERSFLKLK